MGRPLSGFSCVRGGHFGGYHREGEFQGSGTGGKPTLKAKVCEGSNFQGSGM